jgi:hypothetical protein
MWVSWMKKASFRHGKQEKKGCKLNFLAIYFAVCRKIAYFAVKANLT